MPVLRLYTLVLAALLLATTPLIGRTDNVLNNVPHDALGFAVINNLGATNLQAEKLLEVLQLRFPGPLALLKAATGMDEGLNRSGDLLLVALPGTGAGDRPQIGIWLPVSNYNAFIAALNGTPVEGITAVSVAGEDLLVSQRGGWAVVMDPDQRDRLQNLLIAPPAPPAQIALWKPWIERNNITAMLLPSGWRALWVWAAADRAGDAAAVASPDDELFGTPPVPDDEDVSASDGDLWSHLGNQVRAQLRGLPQIVRWAGEIEALACGIRIDSDLNAVAGVRVAVGGDWPIPTSNDAAANADAEPPTLFESGDFIISGAARLPTTMAVAAAGIYARQIADELKDDYQVAMDDEVASSFQKSVEEAAADVRAASILTRPGDKQDGTYSNALLAVRVTDAKAFVDHAAEVMRLWNEMNKSEEDESRLVFVKETAQIAGHAATTYSLDMVEAFGTAAIPEVRPSMERLFGPGGKLRLLVIPAERNVVLLAAATDEQIEPVLKVLSEEHSIAWDERTNSLLPAEADWRLMISPHGYTRWLKRQMDAMLGPVIGTPLVRQFPVSPPVGAAGGFQTHEIWTDVTVPAETLAPPVNTGINVNRVARASHQIYSDRRDTTRRRPHQGST